MWRPALILSPQGPLEQQCSSGLFPTRNDLTHIGTVDCRSHVALSTLSLPSRQWRPVCARDDARYIRRNLLGISVWISSRTSPLNLYSRYATSPFRSIFDAAQLFALRGRCSYRDGHSQRGKFKAVAPESAVSPKDFSRCSRSQTSDCTRDSISGWA